MVHAKLVGILVDWALYLGSTVVGAGAVVGLMQSTSPDISFTVGEIGLMAGLLASVCGALALVFRALQTAHLDRIDHLERQVDLLQAELIRLTEQNRLLGLQVQALTDNTERRHRP